uniref:Striatin N-terminal domain-containing protein n=1 Tax=Panagrolaimus davidi TaxID=227884 RepID=A0A914PBK6_9BILA
MATCYKDKQNIFSYNSQTSKSHDQFDNINLNRNNLSCPDSLNFQSFKRFSPFRNTFKKDHGIFFDGRKKEWKGKNQWSKNDPEIFNIFDKQWNGVKRILTNGSLKYPFEYQRGDDVNKATVPEIMQYKATQHLLNPNSSNISTERNQRQNRLKSVTTTDSNESDKESVKSDANSTDTVVKTENNEQEKKPNDVRIPYTMPGVLHFLQHEWSRAELERTHWEMEKAELKVIFLLVGIELIHGASENIPTVFWLVN